MNQNFPTVIMVPISSVIPLSVGSDSVKVSKDVGLDKESVVLTTQTRSIDKNRLIKKVGEISQEKLEEVEDALKLVLGMMEI